jgi:hypothetical protein
VSPTWLLTLATGAVTIASKGAGALFVPGSRDRKIPVQPVHQLAPLLLPAVLAALITVQVFSSGTRLTLDARAAGLLVATLGARTRLPPIVILLSAAAVTAVARLFISTMGDPS